jgi:hypothetical protein
MIEGKMLTQQHQIIEEFTNKMGELLLNKGEEYSGEDTLSGFKTLVDIGVSPEKSMFVRITDKYLRLKNLLFGGEVRVKDESIEDTLVDLANYACLIYLYRKTRGE